MLCVQEFKLPELKIKPESPEESKIGQLIAENLVDDGATLQMGKFWLNTTENIIGHRYINSPSIIGKFTKLKFAWSNLDCSKLTLKKVMLTCMIRSQPGGWALLELKVSELFFFVNCIV